MYLPRYLHFYYLPFDFFIIQLIQKIPNGSYEPSLRKESPLPRHARPCLAEPGTAQPCQASNFFFASFLLKIIGIKSSMMVMNPHWGKNHPCRAQSYQTLPRPALPSQTSPNRVWIREKTLNVC